MIFNCMDTIEQFNLIYNVGTVMTKSEWEISFMKVRNDVTSSHLQFMNGVSTRFSKTISSC
jgi:hypothetical protein